jgi:P-type conjugative transfer protein TrbL
MLPTIAAAAIAMPAECYPISDSTTSNITYLTASTTNFNQMLGNLDAISSSIFQKSGQAGLYIASVLGVIEVTWFVINTIVLKHNIDEILREMFFKLLTVSFIISLILGLSQNGGSVVKDFSITMFAGLANTATSGLLPAQPQSVNLAAGGGTGYAMQGASNGIISQGLTVADVIVNCPAKLYSATHPPTGNPLVAGLQNISREIVALPDNIDAAVFAVFVMLVYAAIDFLLVATMIDGLLVLSVGIFTLGFANSRWTSDNASSYFRLMFAVGWKIFAYTFIANLGSVLIFDTVANELNSFATSPWDIPSYPPGGIAGLAVVLLLLIVMTVFAGGISKALSSGNFQVGVAGGALRTLLELRLLSYAVGGAAAMAGRAAAAPNAIAKSGGAAAGPAARSGGSATIPQRPVGVSSAVARGVDHDVTSAGINFRPHG